MLAAFIITFFVGVAIGATGVASVQIMRNGEPSGPRPALNYRRTNVTIPPPAAPNVDRKSLRSNLMRSREERITQGKSTQLADSILTLLDYIDALERHVR